MIVLSKVKLTMATAEGESAVLKHTIASFFAVGKAHATKDKSIEEDLSFAIASSKLKLRRNFRT